MKIPGLVITSSPEDRFFAGYCSSCNSVKFKVQGNELSQKEVLLGLFDAHFQEVHIREDASQAAARIVREATEQ